MNACGDPMSCGSSPCRRAEATHHDRPLREVEVAPLLEDGFLQCDVGRLSLVTVQRRFPRVQRLIHRRAVERCRVRRGLISEVRVEARPQDVLGVVRHAHAVQEGILPQPVLVSRRLHALHLDVDTDASEI